MGDSYTAGNGAGHYVGPKGCFRSPRNWGSKVAGHLEDIGFSVDTKNVACNKAMTSSITSPQSLSKRHREPTHTILSGRIPSADQVVATMQAECSATGYGEIAELSDPIVYRRTFFGATVYLKVTATCARSMEPQVDQMPDDTNLVFMTLGGNDIGFAQIVVDCFVAARIADIAQIAAGPVGALGLRQLTKEYNKRCENDIDRARNDSTQTVTQQDLTDAVAAVRDRISPGGEIVLVSYPYLDKAPDKLSNGYRVGQKLKALSDAGDKMQRQVVSDLDESADLGGVAVRFVDEVKDAFDGHEPTGSAATSNDDGYLWELPEIPDGATTTLARVAGQVTSNIILGYVAQRHRGVELADDGLSGLKKGFGPTIYSYYHPKPAGQAALAGVVEEATFGELLLRFCGSGTPLQLVVDEDGAPTGSPSTSELIVNKTVVVTVYNENYPEPRTYTATTDTQGRLTVPRNYLGWGELALDTGVVIDTGDGGTCEIIGSGTAWLVGHGPRQNVQMDFECSGYSGGG